MSMPMGRPVTAVLMAAVAVAAALLGACGKQTPEQDLLQKVEPVASWLATLQMTGEKWTANSVPATFVRTTAEAAGDAFEQAAQDGRDSQARPALRDPLRALISESRSAGDRLRSAAEADDPRAAPPVLRDLAALQARFAALRKTGGESPR
jgi:hypothetical protein